MANCPHEDLPAAHTRTVPIAMSKELYKVCGADIHKRFFVATILSRDGTKHVRRFRTSPQELLDFREWVVENGCERVAVESTGRFWIPIHAALEGAVELIVANAYKIKHTPGKKTDVADSEWIAELCLNNMIEPSRIFPKVDRELRSLTRAREGYVRDLSREKNRVHQVLDSCSIKLSTVLSDIFGVTGLYILNGLVKEKSIDEIIKRLPVKRLRKKAPAIREAIMPKLDDTHIVLLRGSLEMIADIRKRIEELESEIKKRIATRANDMRIARSMPGIGFISAVTILAEIGNYLDFEKPGELAAWAGIVPTLYQSADKNILGKITKHGSKHLRWILVQVAHAIAHTKDSKLKRFFLRIQARKGYNVAIVALARKVLCILHHLLVNQEMYVEEVAGTAKEPKTVELDEEDFSSAEISLEQMIRYLSKAGYEVTWRKSGVGG